MTNTASLRTSRKSPISARHAALLMLAIAPIVSLAPAAHADTWTGNGGNNLWATPGNWDAGAPTAGTLLNFAGTNNLSTTNNIANGTAFGGITFDPSAGAFTLAGNSLTPGGDILDNSTNAQTISLPIILAANRGLITAAGASMTFSGGISGTGFGVTIGNVGPNTVSNVGAVGTAPGGVITGTPAGTVIFSAPTTYTGSTVLEGGTLNVNTDNAFTGPITFGFTPILNSASGNVSTLNINGNVSAPSLVVQTVNTVANSQTINIASGKSLTINGAFTVGPNETYTQPWAGVTSAVKVTGGTLNVVGGTSNMVVGVGRGNTTGSGTDPVGTLDMSGLANFSYSSNTAQFIVGGGNGAGNVFLANTSNVITAATVNIANSAVNGSQDNNGGASNFHLGNGTNVINTTTLTFGNDKSGGTFDFQNPASGSLTIAGLAGGASTADIALGTYINGGAGVTSNMNLANHTVTVQGGNVTIGQLAGGGTSSGTNGTGVITFDTGVFNAVNLRLAVSSSGSVSTGSNGTFTLGTSPASTGVLNVTGQFFLGDRTTTNAGAGKSVATFNVNGGTANIGTDIIDASTTTSSSGVNNTTLNVNGGTLNMNGHNIGSYAAPIANVNLTSGSLNNAASIAGSNISIGSAVTLTGATKFIVANGGTLTSALTPLSLSGAGSGISGGGATAATINGSVALGSGASLTLGSSSVAGTLTFNNDLSLATGSSASFKLTPTPGAGNDLVNVTGNLSLSGTVGLNILALGAGATVGNTYTLFNYSGTLSGNETNFSVAGSGARTTYTVLPTSTTPGSIQVSVGGSPAATLTYIGNVNSNWNLQGDANFKDTSNNPQKFFNLDLVTFDDTSTNLNPVQISGTLQPGSVTVNATRDYTFAGSGSIGGTIPLTKSGNGNLTIANNNTYSGGTTINAGTLTIGNGGTTGSIAGAITNNANLAINRSDAITFANPISGSGNLSISSGSTLTLATGSSYTGNTNILSGTTRIVGGTSLGATNSTANVTVSPGATLDLGGDTTTNDGGLASTRVFHIAGTGVNGVGAITNSGVSQFNALSFLTLDADATISGFRFDIGRSNNSSSTLDLQGHTLTINMDAASNSLFAILNRANLTSGNIVVNTGGTTIETTANILADASNSTITYNPGTKAMFYQTAVGDGVSTGVSRPMVFKGNNIIGSGNTTIAEIRSPMTLNGNVTFEPMSNGALVPASNNPLKIDGNLTESGGSFAPSKLGVNTTTLAGASNSWSGAGTLDAGTLEFAPNPTSGSSNSSIGSYTGNGTLTVDANASVTSGGLQINALNVLGSVKIRNAATPSVSKVNTLTLTGGNGAWTSNLDLTNSKLIIQDAANHTLTLATTRDQVAFGKTNPFGITDSTLPANMGLAVLDNAVLNKSSFGGVSIDANSILVSQELLGDANADGHVDLSDLAAVLNHYGNSSNAWTDGNFDGAATINSNDINAVLNHFGATNPDASLSASPAITAAVPTPEPTSLALLALAAPALLKRRKHA